ncbi:MAG: hypothetical protein ACOZCO_11990 [Bacteroidota bacterium]
MLTNKEIMPKGWTISKFNECCENISLNGIKIKQKLYLLSGNFIVIDQGRELVDGYYNDESLLLRAEGLKDPAWKDTIHGVTLTFNGPNKKY